MRCIDWRTWAGVAGATGLCVLAGCSSPLTPTSPPPSSTPSAGAAASPSSPGARPADAAVARAPSGSSTSQRAPAEAKVELPPPGPVKTWDELRRQAARRIVEANPAHTYMGTPPDQLLAIPVLEVELRRDGSVSRILILRAPREAKDTSEIAIAAIHRAAPFGDVSKLPRPWKFTETFLFNEERKFKPRTLDE